MGRRYIWMIKAVLPMTVLGRPEPIGLSDPRMLLSPPLPPTRRPSCTARTSAASPSQSAPTWRP